MIDYRFMSNAAAPIGGEGSIGESHPECRYSGPNKPIPYGVSAC